MGLGTIRFMGHDTTKKLKKADNDLYRKVQKALDTDYIFTRLDWPSLVDEFTKEWNAGLKKEITKHIALADCWVEDIKPYNILKVYNTNICNGKVFIRTMVVPRLENTIEIDMRKKTINKFKYQCNFEIGVYTTNGYDSVVFENIYEADS